MITQTPDAHTEKLINKIVKRCLKTVLKQNEQGLETCVINVKKFRPYFCVFSSVELAKMIEIELNQIESENDRFKALTANRDGDTITLSWTTSYRDHKAHDTAIAQSLTTSEGRASLAKAMVEPIRKSFEFQAVGRKHLTVDDREEGHLARYERDVKAVARLLKERANL